jgi:hypothetical protein
MRSHARTVVPPQLLARADLLAKNVSDRRAERARLLEDAASRELFLGHLILAERLSDFASELREAML